MDEKIGIKLSLLYIMDYFYLVLFIFVQLSMFRRLKLSVSDVIVGQKRFQLRWKAKFLWAGINIFVNVCVRYEETKC